MDNQQNPTRKLYRSDKDRVVAGVCGGLGKYFDIDPVIFRIVFVLLTLINGIGLLLYLFMVIIIPKESEKESSQGSAEERIKEAAEKLKQEAHDFAQRMKQNESWFRGRNIIALIIIAIGVLALINQVMPIKWFGWQLFWPLILIFIGFVIIFKRQNHER